MERITLGRSGIEVSDFCLGTMTWGRKTPEAEAHAQIDAAMEAGIDFMDTAEMYPVHPVEEKTIGGTEEVIGRWIAGGGDRSKWVIATKAAARGGKARGGEPLTSDSVRRACEASLRRLQTDYIDLYQFHWPDRGSYHFRQNWRFDPSKQPDARAIRDNMLGVMGTLGDLVKEGKIRAFGLSNDSAWGTMEWLRAARDTGGPRVSTMQNEYSLICRHYDTDMAELGHHEDVTLIAFTPLGGGFLTGRYADGEVDETSRLGMDMMGGRDTPRTHEAVDLYLEIARRHGLDPVHMALAWFRTRPFPAMPIFGATTMAQLRHILDGRDLRLSREVVDDIDSAHKRCPMPM